MTKGAIEDRVIEGLGNLEVGHAPNQRGIDIACLGPELQIFQFVLSDVLNDFLRLDNLRLVDIDSPHRSILSRAPLRVFKAGTR